MKMTVVRWNVLCLLLTTAVTQGDLMLTSDKQYAQLQGNITLTCNTSEGVTLVEFQRGVSSLGKCEIELGCSTSNKSKFILNSNVQPVGYDMYTLTIKNFEVNDTGLYRCLTLDTSWQDSFIQITHAGDLMLTSDKQYAQLQGNITLTCNTSEGVTLVEFQRRVSSLGKCGIKLGCSTSNKSKFVLNSNLQPVGYDIYTLTITNFEVNDTGLYRCLTLDTSWQDSIIHITHAGDLMLTSDKHFAQLQGNTTLTCNTSESVTFVEFQRDVSSLGKCGLGCSTSNKSKFILNSNVQPVGYDMYTLTIKNFEVNDTGLYRCLALDTSWQDSLIQITHAVDINSVKLTPKTDLISVIENVPQIFQCVTSTCRPVATISWYLGSKLITFGNESNTLQDVTTSTLNYTFQKRHQDKRILCRGSNGGQVLTSDNQPRLNVLYGPSKPVCRLGGSALSSVVTVREDSEFRLNCTSDGNPLPSFSWIHPGDGPSSRLIINSIQRTHSGRYRIIAENNLIPLEQQAVYLRQDMHLTVDVQFPPVVKPLTNVTVIEEGTVSVVCDVTAGVPSKTDFKWDRMSDMTKVSMEQTLSIASIDRKQAGYYKCTASNYMEPTGHDATVGKSSNTVYIDVQFPPVVKPLTNVTVIEEGTVSVFCEITAGVPSKNDFQWNKMSDSTKVSMEQTLSIANIDRKQTGYYRCTASNYMEPTGHDATVGISSNTVYIDVQYEAEVASFTLSNAKHGQAFEVNENTQVIFYCQAHSNPSSNLALLKQNQYLKTASDAKQLNFTISKSVCEDEGIYQCTAQNEHNTKANIRSLELFVRCAPRASALSRRDQNVSIAPGEPAAFILKLVAFPRPRAKDFVWEKKVSASSTWFIVSNDTDIVITISSDGLQTKLFFSSVDETDFGYYRVHVNNELGNYTETFLLQEQDDSAGSVIAGAVCGTLAAVVVVTVVVVILRRKYTVNCNFERKRNVTAAQSVSGTDIPENNAVHTYDEVSMPNAASLYDALNDRGNGPDDRDLYTPLNETSSKNAVHYENVKKEDHVYNNMMLKHSVQTVL